MNFTFKVFKNRRVVQSMRTRSIRRFLNMVRTINWQKEHFSVYLRVSYGRGFYNDGEYINENEFWIAFNAFRE